jgi:CheY-like chemotaxis protein
MSTPKKVIELAKKRNPKMVAEKYLAGTGIAGAAVSGPAAEVFISTMSSSAAKATAPSTPSIPFTRLTMKTPRFSCHTVEPAQDDSPFAGFDQELGVGWETPNPQSDITAPGTSPVRLTANGHGARGTVLLVQRDAELRSLVRFGLEQQGFRVLEAETAAAGLEVALRSRPGAVLLDLNVADNKGAAAIREFHEWTQIPLLALAGRNNSTGPVAALDRGAADYIPRPFNMEERRHVCAPLSARPQILNPKSFIPAA